MSSAVDDLQGLVFFARVVELRSFTAAAKSLQVSKSVVSERVSDLEERVGERLLFRSTRRLTVTDEGLRVYAHAAKALEAVSGLTTPRASPTVLRVSAPQVFAQLHLAAPLHRFSQAHPDLTLELDLDDRLVDLTEAGVDVAIRVSQLKQKSLVARKLAETSLHVCATPAYLARKGTPQRPDELLQHDCIRYSLLTVDQEWRLYGRDGRVPVPVRAGLSTSSGGLLRAWALEGAGLAMLPRFMVHEELQRGALVTVLDDWAPRPMGIYAVRAGRGVRGDRTSQLITALAKAFEGTKWIVR